MQSIQFNLRYNCFEKDTEVANYRECDNKKGMYDIHSFDGGGNRIYGGCKGVRAAAE